jgi:hypothetical protein
MLFSLLVFMGYYFRLDLRQFMMNYRQSPHAPLVFFPPLLPYEMSKIDASVSGVLKFFIGHV